MKRVVTLLMLIMVMGFMSLQSLSARVSAATVMGFTYEIEGGEAVIKKYDGIAKNLTIPDQLGGCDVTKIENNAFDSNTSIVTMTIGKGIKEIGSTAFWYCANVEEFIVNKENPTFSSVQGVMMNKQGTTLLHYPAGKKSEYNIPSLVQSIAASAFFRCEELTRITIPKSVTDISEEAIFKCTKLRQIIADPNNSHYSSKEGVLYDKRFEKVIFCPTDGQGKYLMPDTVNKIGKYAFFANYNLNSIAVDAKNKSFSSRDGVLYSKDNTVLVQCPIGRQGRFIVAKNTTKIDPSAFAYCFNLSEIVLPEGLIGIGEFAFGACQALQKINLPKSITEIGKEAFMYCYKLSAISVPDRVKAIQESTFYQCQSLATVNLGKGITAIGRYAFGECSSLKTLKLSPQIEEIGVAAFSKCVALKDIEFPKNVKEIGEAAFQFCDGLTRVTWPTNVTEIEKGMFFQCKNLAQVKISNQVTDIGDYAFSSCKKLTEFNWSKNLKSIGFAAFELCKITSVQLPDTLTSIDDYAFFSCNQLNQIFIPKNVSTIGNGAFDADIARIDVDVQNKWFASQDGALYDIFKTILIQYPRAKKGRCFIPATVTKIADNALETPWGITEFVVDPKNQYFSAEDGILYDKQQKTLVKYPTSDYGDREFYVPQGVERIEKGAFSVSNSRRLGEIHFPDSLKEMGEGAIIGFNMVTVYFHGDAPHVENNTLIKYSDYVMIYYLEGKKGFTPLWCYFSPRIFTESPGPYTTPKNGEISATQQPDKAGQAATDHPPIVLYVILGAVIVITMLVWLLHRRKTQNTIFQPKDRNPSNDEGIG